ncbi:MAG: hypothetical protein FWG99_10480 [Treponema sp.]|nr:hypothetical protein [Treponema sp.]
MEDKKFLMGALIIMLVFGMMIFGCSSDKKSSLVGEWDVWSGGVDFFSVTSHCIDIASNGTLKRYIGGGPGYSGDGENKWSVSGKRLTIVSDGDSYEFTFNVKDEMLTIIDKDGNEMIFKKNKFQW